MLRLIFRHVVVTAISLCLVAALGEAVLRSYVRLRYATPGKSIGRWQADPDLGARMAASVYDHRMETNDRGFRGAEDVQTIRSAESLRIVVYGGSTALCWNLADDETWPRRLESELRRRRSGTGISDQVLNGGDINWSIGHVLTRAREELPDLRPEVVLLYSGINEVGNRRLLETEGVEFEARVDAGTVGMSARSFPQAGWWGQHSLLYRAVQARCLRPLVRRIRSFLPPDEWEVWQTTEVDLDHPAVPPDPVTLAHYLRTLEELATLCRRHDSRLVFVAQARGHRTVGLDHLTSYSRLGGEFLRQRGELVIDAQAMVDDRLSAGAPESLFAESGVHYSIRGAALLAEYLANEVPWESIREAKLRKSTSDDEFQ